MKKFYTVQTPTATGMWQCGNSRFMGYDEALLCFNDCAQHIPVVMYQVCPATNQLIGEPVKKNYQ